MSQIIQVIKKPKICNVVCTGNLEQKVSLVKLSKLSCVIYDKKIYNGRCGYVKTSTMDGRVTIFPSGKMISIGGKSIKKAIEQLNFAKSYLVQENIIKEIKLIPKVRNIVATIKVEQSIPIEKLSSKISGAIYNPETFPALIIKGLHNCCFLIFASGKIVIMGAKSSEELSTSSFELIQRLNQEIN